MEEVARVWLTASGGPFLHTPKSQFASITVQQASIIPLEDGQKDHHRLCNLDEQGFEVIEACRLFHLPRNACKSLCITVYDPFPGRIRGWQHTCSNLRDDMRLPFCTPDLSERIPSDYASLSMITASGFLPS